LLVLGPLTSAALVEFFADKTPGVDTGWDALHTFIRLPAGAILAAAAIVGGAIAASTHAVKAGSRVLINTSPEPFSNWGASIGEDLLVLGGLWSALYHPALFLGLLMVFIILMIWLLPYLWRLIKLIIVRLRRFFHGGKRQDLYGAAEDIPLFLVKSFPKEPER